MANIEQIRLPDGVTYDIKDHTIRDEVKYKIYNSVSDLGLTVGSATISDAFSAMPDSSILICHGSDFTTNTGGVPNIYVTVQIIKFAAQRSIIQCFAKTTDIGDYRMFCDLDTGLPTGTWLRYPTGNMAHIRYLVMGPGTTTNVGFTPEWAIVDWYNSAGSFKTQIVGSGWKIYDFAGNEHGYLTFSNTSVTNNADVYLTVIAIG